jgi:hypothetical protein
LKYKNILYVLSMVLLAAVIALSYNVAFVQATTFNQGPRQVTITPQNGVAVQSNGGNATAADNSVAVTNGPASNASAQGNSVAVSRGQLGSTTNSFAQGNSVAVSGAQHDSSAAAVAVDNSNSICNAKDQGLCVSLGEVGSTAVGTASKQSTFCD